MSEEIRLEKSTILFEQGNSDTTAVLFLPGISGEAFSERFTPLSELVLKEGYSIVRINAWENYEDVGSKTISYFCESLSEVLTFLKDKGFENVIAIGKSFGGGLILSYHDDIFIKKILWAPAIGISQNGNIKEMRDIKLGNISSLLDLKLSRDFVKSDTAEINIIHGTTDDAIPLSNSKEIIFSTTGGSLKVIEGANHSFSGGYEESLLKATRGFL